MHSFWILPVGINREADHVITDEIENWGEVSLDGSERAQGENLRYYLWGICTSKAYAAIHVNDRMMMESFQCFLTIRTLRDGHLPCWGFPLDSIGVVPNGELDELIGILGTLPNYAAWKRLRELCCRAQKAGKNLLYSGADVCQVQITNK